jgi:hypothetical protein
VFPFVYIFCVNYSIIHSPEKKCGEALCSPVFLVYMQSWEWTCSKIIPELLEMLERTKLDNFAAAVVILLGQLGRYV